eukprot:TRINITY_DN57262_c0_g1_i1.p2 TRINITY_DN57262_c0_g1~~TRINITY_DN57262_c0_g1_i1.p2  ORF type:complete len:118 (+),score=19.13 TRINITY_DN57262_c0_g1_i1:82-435(+)
MGKSPWRRNKAKGKGTGGAAPSAQARPDFRKKRPKQETMAAMRQKDLMDNLQLNLRRVKKTKMDTTPGAREAAAASRRAQDATLRRLTAVGGRGVVCFVRFDALRAHLCRLFDVASR